MFCQKLVTSIQCIVLCFLWSLKKWYQLWNTESHQTTTSICIYYSCLVFFPQSNVLDRAVDWIFSHLDDLESMDVSEGGRSAAESEGREPPPGPRVRDGPGSEYTRTLVAEMGSETWNVDSSNTIFYLKCYLYFILVIQLVLSNYNWTHVFSRFIQSTSCLRSSVTWGRAQCAAITSVTSRRINSEFLNLCLFVALSHIMARSI